MSQKEILIHRNNIARLFRFSSKMHRNCIRINSGNTLAHELAKFEQCWKLAQEGHEFLTEAEFEHPFKLRADVVDLDSGIVYEIVKSEGEKSIEMKKEKYPLPVEVVRI